MKITFYGTRGSLPVSEREFSHFGGNTACILLSFKNGRVAILDAGTGIRKLGNDFQARNIEQYDNIFIGLSHTHWDHIQGFPFFQPAYDPKRHFTIAVFGKGQHSVGLQSIFETLMPQEYFPVPMDKMGATLTFFRHDQACYIAPSGIRVIASRHTQSASATDATSKRPNIIITIFPMIFSLFSFIIFLNVFKVAMFDSLTYLYHVLVVFLFFSKRPCY